MNTLDIARAGLTYIFSEYRSSSAASARVHSSSSRTRFRDRVELDARSSTLHDDALSHAPFRLFRLEPPRCAGFEWQSKLLPVFEGSI